jgi:hypothetical protein
MKIKSIEIEWEDGERTVFTSPMLGKLTLDISEAKAVSDSAIRCAFCKGSPGWNPGIPDYCTCPVGVELKRLMVPQHISEAKARPAPCAFCNDTGLFQGVPCNCWCGVKLVSRGYARRPDIL